jgi:hypothetical protein
MDVYLISRFRNYFRAPTTFKLEGEVTSLSESSQEEVGDNREKWGDFWEKLIVINSYIVAVSFICGEKRGVPGENHQPVASHWQINITMLH